MGLNASKIKNTSGGNRVEQAPMEAGTYECRVVQVLDLGLQPQRPYQGQDKPPANEIMVTYEFTDEFVLDENGEEQEDKPRWLSETFPIRSLQADLAKSTKRYKAIDPSGKLGGDFSQLVGLPCNVTITSNESKANGKVYNNVSAVTSVTAKKASKIPELVNDPKTFDLDEPDLATFQSLPEWLQDKIKGNLEFNGGALDKLLSGGSTGASEPEPEFDDEDGEGAPW